MSSDAALSKPEISIIVPFHNAEKFIRNSLNSLQAQNFSKFEVLMVNDCSSDGSEKIAQMFSEKDSRFRLISLKDNEALKSHGVSKARNAGIYAASADYIVFLDSDDWLEKDTLSEAYSDAVSTGASIVQWNFSDEYDLRSSRRPFFPKGFFSVFENADMFTGFVTTALYKKSLIFDNDIFFDENISIGEDILFSLRCFIYSSVNYFTGKYLSHYRLKGNGLSHNISEARIKDFARVFTAFENGLSEFEREKYSAVIFKIKLIMKKMALVTLAKPDYSLFYGIFSETNSMLLKQKGLEGFVFLMIHLKLYFLLTPAIMLLKKIDARYS